MGRNIQIALLLALGLMLLAVPAGTQPAPRGAEGARQAPALESLTLRDGTVVQARVLGIAETGIDCELDGDRIRLAWETLAPATVHHVRLRDLQARQADAREYVALAVWCARHPEMHEATIRLLEGVLQRDPAHADALRVLQELDYVYRNGLAWRLEDWQRHQAAAGAGAAGAGDGGAAANGAGAPAGGATEPGTGGRLAPELQPGERLRVSLELTEPIDWGDHRAFAAPPSRTIRDRVADYLSARGFEIVAENPHVRITGRVEISCTKLSTFFDVPIVAAFRGRTNVSLRRVADGREASLPELASEAQRTDLRAALDGVVEELATRLGAQIAAQLR